MEQVETDLSLERRKKDRRLGFLVSMGANLLMGGLWLGASLQLAGLAAIPNQIWPVVPWLVNLGALAAALVFRPQFAVGYLVFFAVALAASMVLGVVFLVACFASVGAVALLEPFGDAAMTTGFLIVLLGVFLGGLLLVGVPLVWLIVKEWKGKA